MTRSKFFDGVTRTLKRELPDELQAFRTRRFGNLLKVYYDVERIHYEVWVDSRRDQIELGLHLEDGPASTVAFLGLLDREIVAIKHQLGPHSHLGRWTQSWGHLVETHDLDPLTAERAREVGGRVAMYIEVLQPIIGSANVSTSPRRKRSKGRRRSE